MAYTQSQIDALRAAIATGALRVRNSNGEEVLYRSLADMRQALAMMEAAVAPARRRRATVYPSYSRWPDDERDGDRPLAQP